MNPRVNAEGRVCCVCRFYKPWNQFNKNRTNKYGHDPRCRKCTQSARQTKAYKQTNRERARQNYADPQKREAQKQRMRDHNARPDIKARKQTEKHKAQTRVAAKHWRTANPEKARLTDRKAQQRYLSNPTNRLSARMSCRIRCSLRAKRASKKGRHWEELVGYTVCDLKTHLEALFEPGMTWANHGNDGWHIDHIYPIRNFQFKSFDDPQFRACWALDNLAPRWATSAIAEAHRSRQTGNLNKSCGRPRFPIVRCPVLKRPMLRKPVATLP